MRLFEETQESDIVFRGRVFTVSTDKILLPNGKSGTREKIHHTGGVCVLALREDGRVPFVRQFRYGAGRVLLELPAGKLEAGEEPEACGRRELIEECGLAAEVFQPLGTVVPTPAYCAEVIHIFLARGLTGADGHLDEDEFLEMEYIPFNEAVDMAARGDIEDAKTVAALFRGYFLCRNQF